MNLDNGLHINVIGVEDLIIHRLESAVVSHPKNPDWTDDYHWAQRMFQIHQNDPEIMDLDYLLNAANKAQVNDIIKNWLKP
ncbi:hypothetical protein [Lentibacillus salinarum]|uniref:hypothetical protein n=1 Tax=Lentibacillus salinarum TaxID=446820 RepID=UPI0036D21FAC